MKNDLHNNIKDTKAIVNATKTATATGAAIDNQDYGSLEYIVIVGASGDTLSGSVLWTITMTECDTSGGTYTTVAAKDILGMSGGNSIVIDDPAEDDVVHRFGYIGSKRFTKVVVTATGTHTNGTPIGAIAIQGHPGTAPVS